MAARSASSSTAAPSTGACGLRTAPPREVLPNAATTPPVRRTVARPPQLRLVRAPRCCRRYFRIQAVRCSCGHVARRDTKEPIEDDGPEHDHDGQAEHRHGKPAGAGAAAGASPARFALDHRSEDEGAGPAEPTVIRHDQPVITTEQGPRAHLCAHLPPRTHGLACPDPARVSNTFDSSVASGSGLRGIRALRKYR